MARLTASSAASSACATAVHACRHDTRSPAPSRRPRCSKSSLTNTHSAASSVGRTRHLGPLCTLCRPRARPGLWTGVACPQDDEGRPVLLRGTPAELGGAPSGEHGVLPVCCGLPTYRAVIECVGPGQCRAPRSGGAHTAAHHRGRRRGTRGPATPPRPTGPALLVWFALSSQEGSRISDEPELGPGHSLSPPTFWFPVTALHATRQPVRQRVAALARPGSARQRCGARCDLPAKDFP